MRERTASFDVVLTLLENHSKNCDEDSLAKRLVGEQRSIIIKPKPEVVHEASRLVLRKFGSRSVDFEHMLCLDLEELKLDNLALLGASSNVGQDLQSLIFTIIRDKPTGTMTCQYTADMTK